MKISVYSGATLRRAIVVVFALIVIAPILSAMPSLYYASDTSHGGVGMGLGLGLHLPRLRTEVIFEAEFVFGNGFGGGLTVGFRDHPSITFDGIYYIDPSSGSAIAFPIKLSAGFGEFSYLFQISGGVKLFAINLYSSYDDTNDLTIDAAVSVGLTGVGFEWGCLSYVSWMGGGLPQGNTSYTN